MNIIAGTMAAIFLPFLGWLSLTLLDIRDRVTRMEGTVPMLYESRAEALHLRDARIADLTERVNRLERDR